MKAFTRICFIFLGLVTLGGCATLPDDSASQAASQTRMDAVMPEVATKFAATSVVGPVVEGQVVEDEVNVEATAWIGRFNDPLLSMLVEKAQANNPGFRSAGVNIERARALAKQAGAVLFPQIGGRLATENTGLVASSADANTSLGLNLSWEVDLWGRFKARRNAAEQSFAAVQADYKAASNLLAANTAQVYFLAIEAEQQRRIANEQVKTLAEILRIVQVRSDNGLASSQDVALSLADLASAKEQLAEIDGAKRVALRALDVLVGKYPTASLELPVLLPVIPSQVAVGLPSDLLGRRPDLIAAERRVAASLNLLHEAKVARLPSFQLTGDLGGVSNGLSNILSSSNLAWRATNELLAPIFAGGALNAQVDIASADVKLSLNAYVDTALSAFFEVETALDQSSVLLRREAMLHIANTQAKKAYDIGEIRYETGESDLLDLLTIQQRLFSTQSSYVSVQRSRLDQYVLLNLALGGDW